MRALVCVVAAAIGFAAHPAGAQDDHAAAKFWKTVQTTCNATAARPASELGRRIAQIARDEFNIFDGHRIDSNGRLFRFGLTEAEHEEDDGGGLQAVVGHLGWWRVMKYWRALYGEDTGNMLEVRGSRDASTSTSDAQAATLLRASAAELHKEADKASDPAVREFLREAAMRAAITDTSWSAAFVSYVVKQAGATAKAFRFANAHRAYIYDAFATSVAETTNAASEGIYRACPLATKPRVGDLICNQRERKFADASDAAVRERVREDLAGDPGARSIWRTHCEVVVYVDAGARKVYTVGGNVNQSVTARKMNLRGDLKFSAVQKGHCGGGGAWTLPDASGEAPRGKARCSLNDKKWFVLLQLR